MSKAAKAKETPKSKPLAVLISDIHYRVDTLKLADAALRQAIGHAKELGVPLYICGDLNDTKAIIRGEVANALIRTLDQAGRDGVWARILVGNHDLLNEKGSAHSLTFLSPYCNVIDEPVYSPEISCLPYFNDIADLKSALEDVPKGSIVLMHQGVKGAYMGEYVVDKTSIDPEDLKDFRCISGHYHRSQTVGTLTYIGSPYTITFAEANDGPKGFQVLMADGSLEHVPTNLRKHVIVERTVDAVLEPIPGLKPEDLLWLKVSGPFSELEKLRKKDIGAHHLGHSSFKLDKISTDVSQKDENFDTSRSSDVILDELIDVSDEGATQKEYLKKLWREIV
jgi:hypothetical protein